MLAGLRLPITILRANPTAWPYFGVTPEKLNAKAVLNPSAAVQVDVAALKLAAPSLPEGSTGRVEIGVPTTPLGDLGDAGRTA